MQAGLYIAYTGARAAEKKMEQIANNLANSSSAGYKQDKSVEGGVEAAMLPLLLSADPEAALVTGEPPGGKLLYSTPIAQYVDVSPGPMNATGNPLDLAIDGEGFFTVATPAGERLTRAGNFHVDAQGDLVTVSGEKVLGGGGPIRVGEGSVFVAGDGQVMVDGAPVDTLRIQKVADPLTLVKEGKNLFSVTPGTALLPAGADTRIMAGMIEGSNVSMMQGMTEMVNASRMFEAYMKMMSTVSELNAKAASDLGRV